MNASVNRLITTSLVLLFGTSGPLRASVVSIGEVGNTIGLATNVDADFDLTADPNIYNSTKIPHVSIQSTNDGFEDVDWYSFSASAGDAIILDIDFGMPSVDTMLALFDSSGNLLAFNDDSGFDAGSNHSYDAFIGTYGVTIDGLYYVAVSNYSNFPGGISSATSVGFLTTPDGNYGGETFLEFGGSGFIGTGFTGDGNYDSGSYTLHISSKFALVPEPTSSIACLTMGTVALAGRRRRS